MAVTAPTFLAESAPASAPPCSRADRSAEMLQSLRDPFQAQPDGDNDGTEPRAAC